MSGEDMGKSALTISLLLLFTLPAFAFEIECERPEALVRRIEFCTQNRFAVESAKNCRDRLAAAFKAAGPELKRILGTDPGKQKESFQISQDDYKKARAKLDHLIEMSTSNLRRIAAYPRVMLDQESGDSVPCFSENAAQLEPIVQDLDAKISELKGAASANNTLLGISSSSNARIENKNKTSLLHQTRREASVKGKAANRSSISGKLVLGPKHPGGSPVWVEKEKTKGKRPASAPKKSKANGELFYKDSEIDSALGDMLGGAVTGYTPQSGVQELDKTPSDSAVTFSPEEKLEATAQAYQQQSASMMENIQPIQAALLSSPESTLFHTVHLKIQDCARRELVK